MIRMQAPAGAVDCHVHVFDPARFAYAESRRYTPPEATVAGLLRMHESLGIERAVFVQPSVYAADNRCLLDAMRRYGPNARGVAVVDGSFSRSQIDDLYAAGIRGVRLNLEVGRERDAPTALQQLECALLTLDSSPMLVQIYAATQVLLACTPALTASPKPVLIDHFGRMPAAGGVGQAAFAGLLGLMASPHIWIKLSGPHQISSSESDQFSDVAPIASELLARFPDRVVWGSDWPHTGGATRPASFRPTDVEAFRPVNDKKNLALVWNWTRTAKEREALLVENPCRLFGL
ncbi:MAG: amidohydrolase family protein [Proteobacteria bacterium]|nr:amidohydrolase family protein [Pseudomonadota bacterium]